MARVPADAYRFARFVEEDKDMTRIARLLANDRGATSVEYAAIASLISIAAIGAMAAVAGGVINLWGKIPAF